MKPEPVLWTCKGCERSAHSSLGPACFCCPLGLLCVKTALRVVYLCLESHWQAHWSATSSNHNQDEGIQLTKKLHWLLNMPQSYRWWEWWPWGREGRRCFAKFLCHESSLGLLYPCFLQNLPCPGLDMDVSLHPSLLRHTPSVTSPMRSPLA